MAEMLVMHLLRRSALVAWAMVPVAALASFPSTACVCANGRVKLVCAHSASCAPHDHEGPCGTSSCCGSAEVDSAGEPDCCGGGICCRGAKSGNTANTWITTPVPSCQPISSLPGVASEDAFADFSAAIALTIICREIAPTPSFWVADVAELNTGPPLDRVIVFRSLLI